MHDVRTQEQVAQLLASEEPWKDIVFSGLDLREVNLLDHKMSGCVFVGCVINTPVIAGLVCKGALVFPRLDGLPYNAYRAALYSPEELFEGFDAPQSCTYCASTDASIYQHYLQTGGPNPTQALEALARRLHDHAITEAMNRFLKQTNKPVVGVMGGHSLSRADPAYLAVAKLGKRLSERGFLVISGGGPGAMEATHVGAWFTGRSEDELTQAVAHLATAPTYKDKRWLSAAFEVRQRFPWTKDSTESLGIPTFLYGHEPPNPFATHIAKYFANSVREDGIVTIADHGLVFAPGSAGTIQEIFQDATQNHYGTVDGWVSVMAFFGEDYWTHKKPIFPIVQQLAKGRPYADLVTISDDIDELIAFIESHPPIRLSTGGWSFCADHCSDQA